MPRGRPSYRRKGTKGNNKPGTPKEKLNNTNYAGNKKEARGALCCNERAAQRWALQCKLQACRNAGPRRPLCGQSRMRHWQASTPGKTEAFSLPEVFLVAILSAKILIESIWSFERYAMIVGEGRRRKRRRLHNFLDATPCAVHAMVPGLPIPRASSATQRLVIPTRRSCTLHFEVSIRDSPCMLDSTPML